MMAGWLALLVMVAGIFWLAFRLTRKCPPQPAPETNTTQELTQEPNQDPTPPEESQAVAAMRAELSRIGPMINHARSVEDAAERLAALRAVEIEFQNLCRKANSQDIEITNEAQVVEMISILKARSDVIKPQDGNILVAIVDTETTGLSDEDEPISIGVLLLEYSNPKGDLIKEHQRYYMLREPGVPIHPRAQAVHGLSLDDLKGQSWDLPALARALSSAQIIAAHNAKFDRRMVASILPFAWHLQWACTLHSLKFEWAKLDVQSRSLDALCARLGIDRPSPHNALTDAISLQRLLTARTGKTARSRTLMGALISNPWAPPLTPK